MKKDGGQLFTYFKFGNKADLLMLYASELQNNEVVFRNEIVKIEDDYRTGDVKDFYEKWNKLSKDNGVWENPPYNFKPLPFTKNNSLRELTEEEGKKLFNGFATILRKHSVSDKPNAFNVIFNLFLAKLYDEQKKDDDELEFHWREDDDPVDFQVRLYNLHAKGLKEFLRKEIEGIQDADFNVKSSVELKNAKKKILKFNKLFDIKSVLDDDDFEQNHRVLKEVVQLIENYRIRYPRKQRYLSEFFELLLTTGLKQESGQYFTPPPIARFIIKSLPLRELVEQSLNTEVPKLPAVIDYAAGSGHFITEIMEEYQNIIDDIDSTDYFPNAIKKIKAWSEDGDPYSWAANYIYGIEKDYRLVKVAKTGCYFYGDGLAQIIHGDGLDSFEKSKSYVGLLKENNPKDSAKATFSILVSNPPYSVNNSKSDLEYIGAENDFELYEQLTDNSSEIECLFVERAKQLLKDSGAAGIILPSSILSNEGIYTKAREIILQNFQIVAITELGSYTFMATGTNTVVLFLRRRSNYDSINLKKSVETFFTVFRDVTMNGVETPVTNYVRHVWDGITFDDYITLLKKEPNPTVQSHEIYKEYRKKIKAKNEKDFWIAVIEIEKEKLFYFILTCPQKTVLVKTGEKDAEKRFLGYEFSNRRGSEGIHPIQRGKTIDECTRLFDEDRFDNETKASTYIYKAFLGDYDYPVHDSLKENISRVRLVDMLTFDRANFEKNISLAVKKKVAIESKWDIVRIGHIANTQYGFTDKAVDSGEIRYLRITDLNDDGSINLKNEAKFINPDEDTKNKFLLKNNDIVIARSGSVGKSAIYKSDKYEQMIFASYLVRLQVDENKIMPDYLFNYTKTEMYWNQVLDNSIAVTQPNLNAEKIKTFQIPLPPKEIQEKIVTEIEELEKQEQEAKGKIEKLENRITNKFDTNSDYEVVKLGDVCEMKAGTFAKVGDINDNFQEGLYPCYGGNGLRGYKKTYTHEGKYSLIGRQGALCGNVHLVDGKFHATEHALVVTPKLNVDTIWLFHKLVSMKLNQYATGTAQPGLSVMNLTPILIAVPPLSEQQKIVVEIEKTEAQITAFEKEIAEIPKQKEQILKKYL
ncbi:MAG: restriction endonuclease subunit S [Planctomycetaceae bacterium]|nr:restriction endonuclease subunit S [Planctomycetaceae bacterium]